MSQGFSRRPFPYGGGPDGSDIDWFRVHKARAELEAVLRRGAQARAQAGQPVQRAPDELGSGPHGAGSDVGRGRALPLLEDRRALSEPPRLAAPPAMAPPGITAGAFPFAAPPQGFGLPLGGNIDEGRRPAPFEPGGEFALGAGGPALHRGVGPLEDSRWTLRAGDSRRDERVVLAADRGPHHDFDRQPGATGARGGMATASAISARESGEQGAASGLRPRLPTPAGLEGLRPPQRVPAEPPKVRTPARPDAPISIWPVPGYTDLNTKDKEGEGDGRYGTRRNPGRKHKGIDIVAPIGTPVVASGDGVVVASGWDTSGGGLRVVIQHSDGSRSGYYHLQEAPVPKVGVRVKGGERVGRIGKTGNPPAKGDPHLHYQVWGPEDVVVDPESYFPK